jgi:hypothetical protein
MHAIDEKDQAVKNTMKVFTFSRVIVTSLAVVAVYLGRRRNRWIQNVRALEATLVVAEQRPVKDADRAHQSWEDLPPVVQRYLRGVFSHGAKYGDKDDSPFRPHSVPMIHSVRFEQKGLFSNKGSWLSFTAHQAVSAIPGNPGFVWEADIDTTTGWWKRWLPKILVCDAWVKGEGHMVVSLHGAIPLVSDDKFADHKDELRKGEMMRWLAEAFLTPAVLLPEAGVVTWKPVPKEPGRAMLSMIDSFSGTEAELEVIFDHKDGIEIKGARPAAEGSSFVSRPWVGRMSDFQFIENMWIPMHMECGWINDVTGTLDLYFTADNSAMEIKRFHNDPFDHKAATSSQ